MRRCLVLAVVACSGRAQPGRVEPGASDRFHDLLTQRDACHTPPVEHVSHADALADAEIAERILRRGYARFEEHHDWETVFSQLHRAIASLPEPIATAELRKTFAHQLAMIGDASLAVWANGPDGEPELVPSGAHLDAYAADLVVSRAGTIASAADGKLVGATLDDCADALRRTPNGSLLVVLAAAPPPPLRCHLAGAELALPLHRLRATPDPERATFERSARPVPVLRLRDLDEANLDALDVFVEAADAVAAAPVAVLDVRGARGGREVAIEGFFTALLGGTLRPPTADLLASEVTLQGELNAATCELARSDVDRDARIGLESHRRILSQALDDAAFKAPVHTHTQPRRTPPPGGKAIYQGTLIVIVDAACSGTCELFVALARQLPHAFVVGENTAGAVAGELLPYRLPHSRLWLQVPASTLVPADAQIVPNTGYLPDLWLDTDHLDPEALARCVLDAACR